VAPSPSFFARAPLGAYRFLQTGAPAEAAAAPEAPSPEAPAPAATAAATKKKAAAAAKKAAAAAAAETPEAKAAAKKKLKKAKAAAAGAVPRALSAYTLFMKDKAKETMRREGLSAPDAMRALSARWAALPAAERAPYAQEADLSKAASAAARAELKARRPPPSAYMAFAAEVVRGLRASDPSAPPTQGMRLAGERWRRLSAGEKAALGEAARAARDAWRGAAAPPGGERGAAS